MFLNYTLDEVYNETTTSILSLIYNVITCIHFSMVPFVVFLILTKSQNMKIYKWYILCEILFCSTTQIVFMSMKLMILCPLPIAISLGPLQNVLASNPDLLVILVEIGLYCLVHFALIVIIAAFYRLAVLFNMEKIVPYFEDLRHAISWIIGLEIIVLTLFYFGFERHRSSANYLVFDNKSIEEDAPFLSSLAEKHQIFGFHYPNDYTTLLSIVIGVAIFGFLAAIFLSVLSLLLIERAKHLRSEQTFKMQLMLYKSVLIQGWNFIVLILTSVGLICMFVVFEIRKTAIMVQLLIAFMEIHGVSDLCFIMYFITPYRKYIKEKIFCRKKPNQVIPKQLTTIIPATVIVKPR